MISRQSLGREKNCILSLKRFWLLNKVVVPEYPLIWKALALLHYHYKENSMKKKKKTLGLNRNSEFLWAPTANTIYTKQSIDPYLTWGCANVLRLYEWEGEWERRRLHNEWMTPAECVYQTQETQTKKLDLILGPKHNCHVEWIITTI